MTKAFQGDVAYLNNTDFGTLLIEIGKQKIPRTIKNPEDVFVARTHAYADHLDSLLAAQLTASLPQDPEMLKTVGLLRHIERLGKKSFMRELPRILRAIARYRINRRKPELGAEEDTSLISA